MCAFLSALWKFPVWKWSIFVTFYAWISDKCLQNIYVFKKCLISWIMDKGFSGTLLDLIFSRIWFQCLTVIVGDFINNAISSIIHNSSPTVLLFWFLGVITGDLNLNVIFSIGLWCFRRTMMDFLVSKLKIKVKWGRVFRPEVLLVWQHHQLFFVSSFLFFFGLDHTLLKVKSLAWKKNRELI